MVIRFAYYVYALHLQITHIHVHTLAEKVNTWLYVCSTPINISKSKFRILIHNTTFFPFSSSSLGVN